MSELFLLGVGSQGLTADQRSRLSESGLIVGSERHLRLAAECNAEKIPITPLQEAQSVIKRKLTEGCNVTVLASGDPFFFGIGRRLLDAFGPERLVVLPALSSMQKACARFRVPWDDVRFVSLHGREADHLPGLLLRYEKTFVFTDRINSPDVIADRIIDYLKVIQDDAMLAGCRVWVAENLGMADERIVNGSLAETAGRRYADLNVLLFHRPGMAQIHPRFGLTEAEISHSRGLITKDEVRAVTLHRLALPKQGVLWDIGAGSGSVSIEAARLEPGLTVYAVEKNESELANIRENIRCYGCYNVVPVEGEAPAVLAVLPDPERVFVGGSGGGLVMIIRESAARLAANGRLVVNGVTPDTVTRAPQLMADRGLKVTVSKVSCERNDFPPTAEAGRVFNPISIVTGKK
jgi:precorrin-6Y C5,15-methyltransferase (decarboxylating)